MNRFGQIPGRPTHPTPLRLVIAVVFVGFTLATCLGSKSLAQGAAFVFIDLLEQPRFPGVLPWGRPSINNAGVVALLNRRERVVQIVDERGLTTVVAMPAGTMGNLAVINDAGRVAFWGAPDGNLCGGIVLADERGWEYLVPPPSDSEPCSAVQDPTLNNSGTVAYASCRPGIACSVETANVRDQSTIGNVDEINQTVGAAMISDSGVVAFHAFSSPTRIALYLYDRHELQTLTEVDAGDGTVINAVDVNNSKQVVFAVGRRDDAEHLYRWDHGNVEQIATTRSLTAAAINGAGDVAFVDAGVLFVYCRGEIIRVVGPGDTLFDRTVRFIEFSEAGTGFNDAGQIALRVEFTDNMMALVRADPQ